MLFFDSALKCHDFSIQSYIMLQRNHTASYLGLCSLRRSSRRYYDVLQVLRLCLNLVRERRLNLAAVIRLITETNIYTSKKILFGLVVIVESKTGGSLKHVKFHSIPCPERNLSSRHEQPENDHLKESDESIVEDEPCVVSL